jgi:hypothetical protein
MSRSDAKIIVHLRVAGGGQGTFFICATVCLPPISREKHRAAITEYDKALSVTFAIDTTSPDRKLAEYRYMKQDALDKVNDKQFDKLSDIQRYLLDYIAGNIQRDFYEGMNALKGNCFWGAIVYFTNVYEELQKKYIKGEITDAERDLFYKSCYQLGFCLCELKLYEKAFYYFDIVWYLNEVEFRIKYINYLVNKKDFWHLLPVQKDWLNTDYERTRDFYERTRDFALNVLPCIQRIREEYCARK